MVFAIGILLIVVSAILALSVSNAVGQKESESQIIANNLAREGIEVVRSFRDSNWLAGRQWDFGLTDSPAAIAEFDSETNTWQFDFNYPDDLLYLSPDGVYSHDASGQPSVFHRYLTFDNICQDASGQENIAASPCGLSQKIGIKVTATVNWSERGRGRTIILEDFLYDWK